MIKHSKHYSQLLSIILSSIVASYKTRFIISTPLLPICLALVQHKDFPLSIVISAYNSHFSKFSYMSKEWNYRQRETFFKFFLTLCFWMIESATLPWSKCFVIFVLVSSRLCITLCFLVLGCNASDTIFALSFLFST